MDRVQAIQEFLKAHDMEEKLSEVLSAVAARNPSAVLIFWEDDEGYGAITLPHSRALAYGLTSKAYDMLVTEQEDTDADETEGEA